MAPVVGAALVAGTLGYTMFSGSHLARRLGHWQRPESRAEALQSCLSSLSCKEKQAAIQRRTVSEFEQQLELTMRQFASFRDVGSSDSEEAKKAKPIFQQVKQLRLRLLRWFSLYLAKCVDQDQPWITSPPDDLQQALSMDPNAIVSGTGTSAAKASPSLTLSEQIAKIKEEFSIDSAATFADTLSQAEAQASVAGEGSLKERAERLLTLLG